MIGDDTKDDESANDKANEDECLGVRVSVLEYKTLVHRSCVTPV